jgi:PTS system nitrogen regulatory IIA component
VAIYFADPPVDFGDGPPVHTLCLLVSPSTRLHLHLLAAVAAVLRDPAVAAQLAARAPDAEILAEIERVEGALSRARSEGLARSDGA